MSRILVTGATGCLGSHLTRELLQRGDRVSVLLRPGDTLGPLITLRSQLSILVADVRSAKGLLAAVDGVDLVYHLAGLTFPNLAQSEEMWSTNVLGTHNVMSACAKRGVRRVVHVSSSAAIGYPCDGIVADEAYDFGDSIASDPYSQTKRAAEEIALSFNSESLEVVVVNPTAVIARGRGMASWSTAIAHIRRSPLVACPRGGSGFCARETFVEGAIAAMRLGHSGQRYILNSENLKYETLARMALATIGRSAKIIRIPQQALMSMAAFNVMCRGRRNRYGRCRLLVPESVRLVGIRLFYDGSKAMRELGVRPSGIRAALLELAASSPVAMDKNGLGNANMYAN